MCFQLLDIFNSCVRPFFRGSTSEKEVSNIPEPDPYPHLNGGQLLGALVACPVLPLHVLRYL